MPGMYVDPVTGAVVPQVGQFPGPASTVTDWSLPPGSPARPIPGLMDQYAVAPGRSGLRTGREVADLMGQGKLNEVGAADLERWMRNGGGDLGQGMPETRHEALRMMQKNIEAQGEADKAKAASVGAMKPFEAAWASYKANNPESTPVEDQNFLSSWNQGYQAIKNIQKTGTPTVQTEGKTPTVQTEGKPEVKTEGPQLERTKPAPWSPIEVTLENARKEPVRDTTGQPIQNVNSKGRKEFSYTNRTPGEFIHALPDELLNQHLDKIVPYMAEKWGEKKMNEWFQKRFYPWEDSTDVQGRAKLMTALKARMPQLGYEYRPFGVLPDVFYKLPSEQRKK